MSADDVSGGHVANDKHGENHKNNHRQIINGMSEFFWSLLVNIHYTILTIIASMLRKRNSLCENCSNSHDSKS